MIELPPKLMYKRPNSSEYEQVPHILDEILNRLENIEHRLNIIQNNNETIH
jgi:hypothetical protein